MGFTSSAADMADLPAMTAHSSSGDQPDLDTSRTALAARPVTLRRGLRRLGSGLIAYGVLGLVLVFGSVGIYMVLWNRRRLRPAD